MLIRSLINQNFIFGCLNNNLCKEMNVRSFNYLAIILFYGTDFQKFKYIYFIIV